MHSPNLSMDQLLPQEQLKETQPEPVPADPPVSEEFALLLKHFHAENEVEKKLEMALDHMRHSLAKKDEAAFKEFWEVRKLAMPLLKQESAISAEKHEALLADYNELTKEARHLNPFQSKQEGERVMTPDQISLAIRALEEEVQGYQTHLEEILEKSPPLAFPAPCQTLESHLDLYQRLQKQLNLLNPYAMRINTLRKELIKVEMRLRQKNKFFQQLSQLGDQVFPPRKEFIGQISDAFLEDVIRFVDHYFPENETDEEQLRRGLFFLRHEIKTLQAVAKILTLNTHAFSTVRALLSRCWDQLKGMEKEFKKEYAEHRQKSADQTTHLAERIRSCVEDHAQGQLSADAALNELDAVARVMRQVELVRHDVRMLKDQLREARLPLEAKQNAEADLRQQKEAEFEKARQQKTLQFKERLAALRERAFANPSTAQEPLQLLTQELEELRKLFGTLSLVKAEKQHLDREIKAIRDRIADRQGQALLELSEDDRAALEELDTLLKQLQERRKEIKQQIEGFRKLLGSSTLDFEKAMHYNELVETEKATLQRVDENIYEIQQKIKHLKAS